MHDTLLGLWGLFASAFISSTIAPGGSEVVLAYMVASGLYSNQVLLIVATTGNTLGALTTYGLGMLAAKKYPLAHLLSAKKQHALAIVEKRGVWVLFFSWLPVIGDVFCFVGGWLKLPIISVTLIILSGKLFRYALIIWFFN
jgi:membrane protein YqaA with SNARE-associated domain